MLDTSRNLTKDLTWVFYTFGRVHVNLHRGETDLHSGEYLIQIEGDSDSDGIKKEKVLFLRLKLG